MRASIGLSLSRWKGGTMKLLLLGCCALQVGCAAGSMLIKVPVEQPCGCVGVVGSLELVHGVLVDADCEKDGAVLKLKEGVAQNSPEQIRPFAQKVKGVVPGEAGSEIAMILSGEVEAKAAG